MSLRCRCAELGFGYPTINSSDLAAQVLGSFTMREPQITSSIPLKREGVGHRRMQHHDEPEERVSSYVAGLIVYARRTGTTPPR